MANLYDQQFKDRLTMHQLVCDPVSAELIGQLRYFLERERRIRKSLEALTAAQPTELSAEQWKAIVEDNEEDD